MDIQSIREYAKIMKEMELTALEITAPDLTRVRLERNAVQNGGVIHSATAAYAASEPAAAVSVQQIDAAVFTENETETSGKNDIAGFTPVTSPMVGVFYAAPGENAEPYVKIGDKVKKGDVLCIIEAMKLMNEITAEEDGIIAEICVSNGQVVDFGHILFKLSKQ